MLHMLRTQLGDDAFFRGLRSYYQAHKDATANSEDLRAALEKASGKDLKGFFARWVYGTGHPRYQVSSLVAETPAAGLRFILTQTQPEGRFSDPVPIEVTVSGRKTRHLRIYPRVKLEKLTSLCTRGQVAVQEFSSRRHSVERRAPIASKALRAVVVQPHAKWLVHAAHSVFECVTTELNRCWYSADVINEQTMPR